MERSTGLCSPLPPALRKTFFFAGHNCEIVSTCTATLVRKTSHIYEEIHIDKNMNIYLLI